MSEPEPPEQQPEQQPEQRLGPKDTTRRRAVLSELAGAQAKVQPNSSYSGVGRLRGSAPPRKTSRWLLLGALLVALVAAVGGGLWLTHQQSIPNPPAAAGSVPYYVDLDIPWATVTLDSAPLRLTPVAGGSPIYLAPGKHEIRWKADPFEPQGCQISVPVALTDTCPNEPAEVAGVHNAPDTTRVLYLRASLATLSARHRATLTTALQAATVFTTAMQSGERYPLGPSADSVTIAPATASLYLRLALNPAGVSDLRCQTNISALVAAKCEVAGRNCIQLCTAPWPMRQTAEGAPAATEWLAFGVARLSWTMTTQDGKTLAQNQPVGYGGAGATGHLIAYHITWNGVDWSVQPLTGATLYSALTASGVGPLAADPACVAAYDAFFGPGEQAEQRMTAQFVSGADPAAGCLVTISILDAQGTPTPGSANAQYLFRFTQILAANEVSQRISPTMAPVTGIQRTVALQLGALSGQIITT